MNSLRLILLILGLAVIAGIFLWETRKQRLLQRRSTVLHEPRLDGLAPMRAHGGPEGDLEDDAGDTPIRPALRMPPSPAREPASPDLFRSMPQPGPGGEDTIIALHVAAAPGTAYRGRDIAAACGAAGLTYGPMNIFHRFGTESGAERGQPLFSVASMHEPGAFDMNNLDALAVRGLTLFRCLSAPREDDLAVELMIRTAELLAETLGGEVQGPDRRRLDAAGFQRLREQGRRGRSAAGPASNAEIRR